ncbi:DUF5807 family protein [Halonotius pteroides]|uniref:Uncharacterized protein n=1 Tax=Halonotius pteroides TaxID=268735 RepID=A0A3A6QHZ5_9EURY|nr:DUF5807 family protein [Halonotius pteroides]RJX52007.1 hypothetical protein DP106_00785 [Halonotius pteroides]
MDDLTAFLAGDRLDDVAIYVADTVVDTDHPLSTAGIAVDGGVVVVVAGETGREAFADSTGLDPMAFAKQAMDRTGEIDDRLAGGVCPAAADDPTASHHIEFGFAFAEAENEEVGGLYAEGDVIHAYAHCSCGTDFSQKWVADPPA